MKTLLFALLLSPALAHAEVDFKCDSVKYEDQVGGWIRFDSGGKSGNVNLEHWVAYPPITLVDADIASPKALPDGVEFALEGASLSLPSSYATDDKFVARAVIRSAKYDLTCIRH